MPDFHLVSDFQATGDQPQAIDKLVEGEEAVTTDRFVSLKDLAERLGMDRSHARRYILKLGYSFVRRRTPQSSNQLVLTVSEDEADAILERRKQEGFLGGAQPVSTERGYFYAIQLVPEFHPGRLKLGFAGDVNDRLAQHRTAAPTARLLKKWPCKQSWERTAIDSLTAAACRLVANEVFECEDVDGLLQRGDAFFSLMPDPTDRIPLADTSPFRGAR